MGAEGICTCRVSTIGIGGALAHKLSGAGDPNASIPALSVKAYVIHPLHVQRLFCRCCKAVNRVAIGARRRRKGHHPARGWKSDWDAAALREPTSVDPPGSDR